MNCFSASPTTVLESNKVEKARTMMTKKPFTQAVSRDDGTIADEENCISSGIPSTVALSSFVPIRQADIDRGLDRVVPCAMQMRRIDSRCRQLLGLCQRNISQ
jgi:hypothetical protein